MCWGMEGSAWLQVVSRCHVNCKEINLFDGNNIQSYVSIFLLQEQRQQDKETSESKKDS